MENIINYNGWGDSFVSKSDFYISIVFCLIFRIYINRNLCVIVCVCKFRFVGYGEEEIRWLFRVCCLLV